MKVLMLTPYLPYPLLSGGQIRTYNLLKKLAKKHEVTLFALIKESAEKKHIKELERYCQKVVVFKRSSTPFTLQNILKTAFSSYPFLVIRNHVPAVISAVKKELNRQKYDLIHAETFYMMPHIPKTTVPIILVEQTIEYLGYESYAQKAPRILKPLLAIDIAKIKKWEKFYWNYANKLIVMSHHDKNLIGPQLNSPQKIEVVENGVDTDWFAQTQRQEPADPTILSVGTFKWLPNVEAVEYLVTQIWPLIKAAVPNVKLKIVGNAPTKRVFSYQDQDSSIQVTGKIDDIRDAFTTAQVLVAPVLSGKGTRYKILEAMAAGTPVVATSTAVEGLGVTNGEHVLLGDSAQAFANQTVKLIKQPTKRHALATNGRAFVTKHYDWSLISKKLDAIYRQIGSQPTT